VTSADALLDVRAAARLLQDRIGRGVPDAVLVLGSGLSALVDAVEDPVAVPFADMPGFPGAGVAGHLGRWVAGSLEGRRILVQAGRYHVYEGHPLDLVHAPVRIAATLGARALIVTNAAGAVRRDLDPGTLVRLTGLLDLMEGIPPSLGDPAGGDWICNPAFAKVAEACARELAIRLERGVYAALTGPSYETPAEIRALARMGADVVGMSTAPELAVAHEIGLRCLAISLVTNHAAGISPHPLDHAEVLEIGRRSAATLERLLRCVVRGLPAA
jgi:purine-nucleoside phosphorylase